MKFTTLVFAILVFAISAANAVKEQALISFSPGSDVFSPQYKLSVSLLSSDTTYEITLDTDVPDWYPFDPSETSYGVATYEQEGLTTGPCSAIIYDNDDWKDDKKTFRLSLMGPAGIFHFVGESVTKEQVYGIAVEGELSVIHNNDFGYSRHRFYRHHQDRYPCKH
ncbi:hypothetical protein O0I10_008752 [Lichtheimia ornata]|uniref:Dystroglycan-type cadherin-like domain-containing protein n=1 Tax=Lichtheimia ornata TaxID=688661 RepID=A0AAD7V0G1_9FUNG|nr:uncharacterized protein O0I10_008752 [Lichtheimia ornata]KAJ8655466.1 hypothetical protein O0I10_008752 [Lichtheimia ornata]